MNNLAPYTFAAVALVGSLALITVWAPRRLAAKLLAICLAALCIPAAYAATIDLLSRPKPVALEWWLQHAEEATVLGSQIHEGEGIHLWLQLDGALEPRAYVLPWDRETAEQLQAALSEAHERGSELRMRMPFEQSLDNREPKFYAMPQPALPPKDFIDPPPMQYQRPEVDA